MPIYFDKSKKRWRFTFNRVLDGRRYRASRLLPAGWSRTRADAYDRAESGRLYALASGIERAEPFIEQAVKLYLDGHIPRLRNGKKAAQDLAHLIPYFTGKTFAELPELARAYARDHPWLARATVRNRLAYLRAACRYAHDEHGLGETQPKVPLPAVDNERHVYLRPPEFRRLLSHVADPETRAILTLAFYTGLRWRSEILTLTRERIIKERGQVWLMIPDTKNRTPHMIPVHSAALDALEHVPFKHGDSYHYTRFWKARDAAGLPHVRFHDQRHSLASALISRGATLPEVGRVLGHKSVMATKRYAHLYPERVREMILKLPGGRKNAHRKKAAGGGGND